MKASHCLKVNNSDAEAFYAMIPFHKYTNNLIHVSHFLMGVFVFTFSCIKNDDLVLQ